MKFSLSRGLSKASMLNALLAGRCTSSSSPTAGRVWITMSRVPAATGLLHSSASPISRVRMRWSIFRKPDIANEPSFCVNTDVHFRCSLVDGRHHDTFDGIARPVNDPAANRFGVNLAAEEVKCQDASGK